MKLLLLGAMGYHPNEWGHTSCYMLPESGALIDAGTATFRIREHLQRDTLDIFLTHAHLDHVIGLTYLLDVLQETPVQRVRVHAVEAKLDAIRNHVFSPHLFPVEPPFETHPLDRSVTLADGGRLTHFALEHPGGSVGYRIDWPDRSMALVTDTIARPDAPYVSAIRGVDLLVHECYFPDGWEEQAQLSGHSCTTPVASVASAAGVGRLVLVHVSPMAESEDPIDLAVAREIFPATEIGRDKMAVEF
jgi:ribonuclease BN (tRNA processing enzyme)